MDSAKYWAKALQISDSQISQWRDEAPGGVPFTHWCVLNKKLDEEVYLNWAREFYSLPSLQDKQYPSDSAQSVYQANKDILKWSNAFFPIAEWDGILYVACAEPIVEVRFHFPVQFILTKPSFMNSLWNSWSATNTPTQSVPEQSIDTPVKVPMASAELTETVADDVIAMPAAEAASDNVIAMPAPEAATDDVIVPPAPENIVDDVVIPPPPENMDSMENLELSIEESETPLVDDIHAVQEETQPGTAAELPSMPEGLDLDPDLFSMDATVVDDINPLDAPAEELMATPEGLNFEPEASAEVLQFPEVAEAQSTPPPSDIPDNVPSPTETPSAPPSEIFQADPQGSPTGPTEFLPVMEQIKTKFRSVQVLTIEGDQLVITAHDGTIMNPETKIPLNLPSLFKIVFRSKHPFHGSVNNSEVHADFYNKILASTPEHVTAAPIISSDKVWGLIVCNGTKENNTRGDLNFVTEIANSLATVVEALPKAA